MRTIILLLVGLFSGILPDNCLTAQLLQRQSLIEAARRYPFRTWTDRSGLHQTMAKYLRHDASEVTIMKRNHLVLVVPISQLSKADQQYLTGLGGAIDVPTTAKSAADHSELSDLLQSGSSDSPHSQLATASSFTETSADANLTSEVSARAHEQMEGPAIRLVNMKASAQYRLANEGLLGPLSRSELYKVRQNLEALLLRWPREATDDLVWAVAICAESGHFAVDEKGLQLLAKTDPKRHLAIWERAVNRPEFNLRKIAYASLAQINNERSRSILLRKFYSSDDGFLAELLPQLGSSIEDSLLEHLTHSRPEHVLLTCAILAEIGTDLSVEPLNRLVQQSELDTIRQAATDSIDKIRLRLAKTNRE